MRVYKWEGGGHYLGAVVIVCAKNKKEARELISQTLTKNGLSEKWEESQEVKSVFLDRKKVIYLDNGDY